MIRAAGPADTPHAAGPIDPCVILGVAGDERTEGFRAALVRAGHPPATVFDYADFIEAPERLGALFLEHRPEGWPPAFGKRRCKTNNLEHRPGSDIQDDALEGCGLLRIDSPGGDPRIRRALLNLGGEDDAEEAGEATRLRPDHDVQRGLAAALRLAREVVPPGVALTHEAETVTLFYDKRACHAAMAAQGLPVPRALPPAGSFDALHEAMRAVGLSRVFVKPRFGSGAAGIAALTVARDGIVADSAAEHVPGAGAGVLHHSHRMRRYRGASAVALVDAILAQDAHVEQWVPKAALDGGPCDLRVLVVGGEPAHIVVRKARGPITNLDLGGHRADADALRALAPPAAWEVMLADCRRFARLFPQTFHAAFDVALTVGLRRHVFFEANAFGDLIRRVRHEGLDPYAWQVARLPGWIAACRPMECAA